MELSDIVVTGGPRVLAKSSEVAKLEKEWWIRFPRGYLEYVTTLGEGVLGGTFIRILPPWRISKELVVWRQLLDDYWHWDAGKKLLPKDRALECIPVGETLSGDMLIFHPSRPDQIFALPRDGEQIYLAGKDILSAVDWVCSSGKLTRRFRERRFEPFDSRKELKSTLGDARKVTDPPGQTLNDIVRLGKAWSRRNSVRRLADLDSQKYLNEEQRLELLTESIVISGGKIESPGYVAIYQILEQDNQRKAGTFIWRKSDISEEREYTPSRGGSRARK